MVTQHSSQTRLITAMLIQSSHQSDSACTTT